MESEQKVFEDRPAMLTLEDGSKMTVTVNKINGDEAVCTYYPRPDLKGAERPIEIVGEQIVVKVEDLNKD